MQFLLPSPFFHTEGFRTTNRTFPTAFYIDLVRPSSRDFQTGLPADVKHLRVRNGLVMGLIDGKRGAANEGKTAKVS